MKKNGKSENDVARAEFRAGFRKLRFIDHAVKFAQLYWLKLAVAFMATLAFAMLLIEAAVKFFDIQTSGLKQALVLFGFLLLISLCQMIYKYINHCPVGFESNTKRARRLAHLQPQHWEALLAKELLVWDLFDLQIVHQRIVERKMFVPATRKLETKLEYSIWVRLQIDNFHEMIEIFNTVVIEDLISSIYSDVCMEERLQLLKKSIGTVVELQRSIVKFESESLSVMPPDGLEDMRRLHLGWSNPISDGITELLTVLQRIIDMDPKSKNNELSYTIRLRESEKMAEFTKRFHAEA